MANDKYIIGLFDHEDKLIKAVRAFKEKGIEITNTLTPFPVHGLEGELGLKENRLHTAGFIFGVTGLVLALFIMTWVFTINYPLNVGGKPFFSLPAFIPIIFELMVLFAAVGMVMVYMIRNNLAPGHIPRIFDDRITDDRFALLFEVTNDTTKEDINAIACTLKSSNAVDIKMKEFDDEGEPFTSIDREFVYDTNCGEKQVVASVSAPEKVEEVEVGEPKEEVKVAETTPIEEVVEEKSEEEYKNQLLDEVGTASEDDKDELKRIKGIGKVYEARLNSLGIFKFAQIAKLKDGGIEAIEAITGFPGRVTRENWVGQAKILGEGGATEFSARVDKGDVDYKKSEEDRYKNFKK